MKTAKLTPTDPSPFRQLGRMYAIPLLKSKVKTNTEKAFKKVRSVGFTMIYWLLIVT